VLGECLLTYISRGLLLFFRDFVRTHTFLSASQIPVQAYIGWHPNARWNYQQEVMMLCGDGGNRTSRNSPLARNQDISFRGVIEWIIVGFYSSIYSSTYSSPDISQILITASPPVLATFLPPSTQATPLTPSLWALAALTLFPGDFKLLFCFKRVSMFHYFASHCSTYYDQVVVVVVE